MRLAWVSIVLATLVAFLIPALGQAASDARLRVFVAGAGTVVSNDQNISCPPKCEHTYQSATYTPSVELTARPDPNEQFQGWGGECTGATKCIVTMDQNRDVSATFTGSGGSPTATATGSPTSTASASPSASASASPSSSPSSSPSASPDPSSGPSATPSPKPIGARDRMEMLVAQMLERATRSGKKLKKRRLILGRTDDLCPRGCRVKAVLEEMTKETFSVSKDQDPRLVLVVPRGIVGNGDIRARLRVVATDSPTGAQASDEKRIILRRG